MKPPKITKTSMYKLVIVSNNSEYDRMVIEKSLNHVFISVHIDNTGADFIINKKILTDWLKSK